MLKSHCQLFLSLFFTTFSLAAHLEQEATAADTIATKSEKNDALPKINNFLAQCALKPQDKKTTPQQTEKKPTTPKKQLKKQPPKQKNPVSFKSVKDYLEEKLNTLNTSTTRSIGFFSLICTSFYYGYKALLTSRPNAKSSPIKIMPLNDTKYAKHYQEFLGDIPSYSLKLLIKQYTNSDACTNIRTENDKHIIVGAEKTGKTTLAHTIAEQAQLQKIFYSAADVISMFQKNYSFFYAEELSKKGKKTKDLANGSLFVIENIDELPYALIYKIINDYERFKQANPTIQTTLLLTAKKISDHPEANVNGNGLESLLRNFSITQMQKPDKETRLKAIIKFSKQYNCEDSINCSHLADDTYGMNISDIENIFQQSNMLDTLHAKYFTSYKTIKQQIDVQRKKEHEKGKYQILPTINFSQVIGTIPTDCKIFVDQLKNPQYYQEYNLKLSKGLLFYGEPGTGKTLLAQAIAGEAKAPFFAVSASELSGKYINEGVEKLSELWESASQAAKESLHKTAIIFIDEIDAIGCRRPEGTHTAGSMEQTKTLNHLLQLMDGCGHNDDTRIFVIAATNNQKQLDPALTRPGRFDDKIKIEKPNDEDRVKLIEYFISKNQNRYDKDIKIEKLKEKLAGMTQAEIKGIFTTSARNAAHSREEKITWEHIHSAITDMQKRRNEENRIKVEKAYKEHGY